MNNIYIYIMLPLQLDYIICLKRFFNEHTDLFLKRLLKDIQTLLHIFFLNYSRVNLS